MAQNLLHLINVLFATKCDLDPRGTYPMNVGPFVTNGSTYDFIIVGGGTAGTVLATRLAEVSSWNVLLLEAGDFPTVTTEVPTLFPTMIKSPQDWNYKFERQNTSCRTYEDGICRLPRGKLLGGTSSMNGLAHVRSPKENYDAWAKAGNEGWKFSQIEKYFKKSERVINASGKTRYGKDGPIAVNHVRSRNPIRRLLLNAAGEAGLRVSSDEENLGLFEYALNVDEEGTRGSCAKGYIASKGRRNRYLGLNMHVTKVLIDDKKRAYGVEVWDNDNKVTVTVFARKEVVVAGGVVNSPQLLMLSGVGPKEHLQKLGIRVRKNLCVGKNFHDHAGIRGLFIKFNLQKNITNQDTCTNAIDYCLHRNGTYSGDYGLNMMYSFSQKNAPIPDVNAQVAFAPKNSAGGLVQTFRNIGTPQYLIDQITQHSAGHDLLSFSVYLAHPKFRGEILLKSRNPFEHPIIRSNLFDNDEDVESIAKAIASVKSLLNSDTLRKANAEFVNLEVEECKQFKKDSSDYWKCFVHNMGYLYYHSVGTCKMGPSSDKQAVVNPSFEVYGINNLRVIDASAMPEIVSRNTMSPVVMMAEKGADLIKSKHLRN